MFFNDLGYKKTTHLGSEGQSASPGVALTALLGGPGIILGAPGCVYKVLCVPLGVLGGSFWDPWERLGAPLGCLGDALGVLGGAVGMPLGSFGFPWWLRWSLRSPVVVPRLLSAVPWGAKCAKLLYMSAKTRGPRGCLGCALGVPWGALGVPWRCPGGALGAVWGLFWVLWGRLGLVLATRSGGFS